MTGWVIAAAFAICLMVLLVAIGRIPRVSWELTAAALLLGLAGYAWQGNPGLAGAPRSAAASNGKQFDEQVAQLRRGMAERYGPAGQWLMLSDGLGRQGKTKESANVLLAGIKQSPGDPNLWLGLGNALVHMREAWCRRALTLLTGAPCRLTHKRLLRPIFTAWLSFERASCRPPVICGRLWLRGRLKARKSRRNWSLTLSVSTQCWLTARLRFNDMARQLRWSKRRDRAPAIFVR